METSTNGVFGYEKTDLNLTIGSGFRVLFEDDSLRTLNKLSSGGNFVVNITEESLEASNSQFLGNGRALQVLGDDAVNINGSNFSEIIIGNDGANLIRGGGGNDYIVGNSGADILLGQAGNDVIVGGSSARVFSLAQVDSIEPWGSTGIENAVVNNRFEVDSETWLHEMSATNGFVKFTYSFSGGTGISYYTTPSATTGTEVKSGTSLYGVVQQDGGHHYIKFATSEAFAKAGNFLDISSLGTATRQNVIVDYTYTTGNGDDYISGGSGNDVLVSYGVQGSLTATNKDTVTALGGSGADTMIVMASTGVTNFFGGSGADTFVATEEFLGTSAKNKQATFFDFSSVTDDIAAPIDFNDVQNMQTTLAGMEVNLTPLVPPEVKVIGGSGEDGNYVDYRQDESIYSSNNEFVDLVWSVDPNIGLAEILAA
jgi:Ca2+-binding RTX toxin-like protein